MQRHRTSAFTLPELLVVVTVIALLAAMILPFFNRTFETQRKITCSKNLQNMGQAVATRGAHGALSGQGAAQIMPISWQQDLMAHLGGDTSVFMCPSDPRELSESLEEGARETLQTMYIEVYTGGFGRWLWNVPLDETISSEWIWRLSPEQFDEFVNTPGHGQNYDYTGYQPGEDPYTYWFVFEDQGHHGGGDKDYWDVMLKIETTDTSINITPKRGGAGYTFKLSRGEGENKEVLIDDVEAAEGQTTEIEGIGMGSYGINSMVGDIHSGETTLMVLDYVKHIARGSDFADRDDWFGDEDDVFEMQSVDGEQIPTFFRHFGRVNALFANGSVQPMGFEDIRIDQSGPRQRYWNPESMR